MEYPIYTPWGKAQNCHQLCKGAFMVTTAGHGGIMIAREMVDTLLSEPAKDIGFFEEYGHMCFEEDCAAPVAFRELLDRKLISTYPGFNGTPEEFVELIDEGCQRWHPEYWAARAELQGAQATPSLSNQERIQNASEADLVTEIHAISLGHKPWCDYHCENQGDDGCDKCIQKWLQKGAE